MHIKIKGKREYKPLSENPPHRKRDWHCQENVVDVVTTRAENVDKEIRKRGIKHSEVETVQDKGGLRRFQIRPTNWDGEPKEGGIGE